MPLHVLWGHVVDVTEDWCESYKPNKALVLRRKPLAVAMRSDIIIAIQAGWTDRTRPFRAN